MEQKLTNYPSSCVLQRLPPTFSKSPLYVERRQRWSSILQRGPHDPANKRQSEISISPWANEGGRRGRWRGARNLNLITSQLAVAVPSFTWRYDLCENPLSLVGPDRTWKVRACSWGTSRGAKLVPLGAEHRRTRRCPRTPRNAAKSGETPARDDGGRKGEKKGKQTCREPRQVTMRTTRRSRRCS